MHIYFHEDFDGIISAVLVARYFRDKHNDYDIHFHPVDYHLKYWESTALESPSCVVDFKYHPNCDYWFDHHHDLGYESLKVREQYSDKYKLKEQKLYCDPEARSCAFVVHERLFPNREYLMLVDAADYIDSAAYPSVDQACFGTAPADRLNRIITNRTLSLSQICKDMFVLDNYFHMIIRLMRTPKYNEAHKDTWYIECKRFIKYLDQSGSVMNNHIVEYDMLDRGRFNRYLPFWEYPECEYAVGFTGDTEEDSNSIRIAVGKNPWNNKPGRLHVGKLLKRLDKGGGGHTDVGSVRVDNLIRSGDIYDEIIKELEKRRAND